jgi:hypothetical protein
MGDEPFLLVPLYFTGAGGLSSSCLVERRRRFVKGVLHTAQNLLRKWEGVHKRLPE